MNYRGLFVDKGSVSGIFPDPDPGGPKRPDPTGTPTLVISFSIFKNIKLLKFFAVLHSRIHHVYHSNIFVVLKY